MNSTSHALANETPKYDENATPQDVGAEPRQLTMGPVPVPKSKPTISLLRVTLWTRSTSRGRLALSPMSC